MKNMTRRHGKILKYEINFQTDKKYKKHRFFRAIWGPFEPCLLASLLNVRFIRKKHLLLSELLYNDMTPGQNLKQNR